MLVKVNLMIQTFDLKTFINGAFWFIKTKTQSALKMLPNFKILLVFTIFTIFTAIDAKKIKCYAPEKTYAYRKEDHIQVV